MVRRHFKFWSAGVGPHLPLLTEAKAAASSPVAPANSITFCYSPNLSD
jgi:hypothetical protein